MMSRRASPETSRIASVLTADRVPIVRADPLAPRSGTPDVGRFTRTVLLHER